MSHGGGEVQDQGGPSDPKKWYLSFKEPTITKPLRNSGKLLKLTSFDPYSSYYLFPNLNLAMCNPSFNSCSFLLKLNKQIPLVSPEILIPSTVYHLIEKIIMSIIIIRIWL